MPNHVLLPKKCVCTCFQFWARSLRNSCILWVLRFLPTVKRHTARLSGIVILPLLYMFVPHNRLESSLYYLGNAPRLPCEPALEDQSIFHVFGFHFL